MKRSPAPVAALLFCSGFCALIYQTAWLRQFRLIFGASTFATAAVLAIFMAGLGAGSAVLGRRADAHPRPLAFYGQLELGIALSAAISPLLLMLVAKLYFAVGGSVTLGLFFATIVRLILSVIVLGIPTFLMGGTLPAAARAVETSDDAGRARLALLYGTNTLGAVTGTLVSTFYMLEAFGNRATLFMAVAVNVVVAVVAWRIAKPVAEERHAGGAAGATQMAAELPPRVVLAAAAIVGFAFLLMELVWYRMLAPLLGGSTFTFGLILAVALLGIGAGGAAYSFFGAARRRATAAGFALTCAVEALAIGLPFALGDRLAIIENLMRRLGSIGFDGHVIAWTLLTFVVVFPAALVSGIQFPLLIALLGSGSEDVGRHAGYAYAWNTAGAIAGSLAGGFGLLPLLSAPGTWQMTVLLLALLGAGSTIYTLRRQRAASLTAVAFAIAAVACTTALGPTALWRHSGIGAGRSMTPDTINATREWTSATRRTLVWDADGRESSVALVDTNDLAFIVNGKADGSARGDAGTQVMSGMIGATIHPAPRRALVIGLGTGSTAGWLGAVPEIERVDAVELEPAILGVAAACAPVNHDVLHNPKVVTRIADAREVLLASREQYDIVFSEPSNPYRAGIASLFTEDFYRATTARLKPGAIFLQWMQTYDVDAQTIRTIYATIGRVFPYVDTWTTDSGDILLAASMQPIVYDIDRLRTRVRSHPFLDAMSSAWRVETVEGFFAHFLASDSVARLIANGETAINTDDRTLVEFGFARGLGEGDRFDMSELAGAARASGGDRPAHVRGAIDWNVVAANRASISWVNLMPVNATPELAARHRASIAYSNDNLAGALLQYRARPFAPMNTGELTMVAESLAEAGSGAAALYAEQLRPWRAIDADLILARLHYKQHDLAGATAFLERAFVAARGNPWATMSLFGRSLDMAGDIARSQHTLAVRLVNALARPFAAGQWEDARRYHRALMAADIEGCGPHTVAALHALEPWPPWRANILTLRRDCYASAMDSLADDAKRDYARFRAAEPPPLVR